MSIDDRDAIHIYSVEELNAVAHLQETEAWPAQEALRAVEKAYREGYRDGFYQGAADADGLRDKGIDDAFDRHIFGFWNGALLRWVHQARYKVLGHPLMTAIHKDYPASDGGDWPPHIDTTAEE